jgi:hypothetical protein
MIDWREPQGKSSRAKASSVITEPEPEPNVTFAMSWMEAARADKCADEGAGGMVDALRLRLGVGVVANAVGVQCSRVHFECISSAFRVHLKCRPWQPRLFPFLASPRLARLLATVCEHSSFHRRRRRRFALCRAGLRAFKAHTRPLSALPFQHHRLRTHTHTHTPFQRLWIHGPRSQHMKSGEGL